MASVFGEQGGERFDKNWQDKLRLMDAIDSLRGPAEPEAHPVQAAQPVARAAVDDNDAVRKKLHVYEQTCAMLEREVQVLEQQTLAALAEAGRLRRELDKNEEEKRRSLEHASYAGRDILERRIADSETERRLLLDALENSESELARMVKTLDLVVRKLQVA